MVQRIKRDASPKKGGCSGKPPVGEFDSGLSRIEQIHEIVKQHAKAEISTEQDFILFLKHWWSEYYKRPLKDPLLESYTLEELTYEYYDKIERQRATEEAIEEESDRIEDEALESNLAWAEEEEKREREEALRLLEEEKEANEEWMKQELEKAKKQHGDDYGEDVSLDFSE